MPEIGVRELEARAPEIIRELRENRTRYVVTYHGQPMGMLIPLEDVLLEDVLMEETGPVNGDAVWAELMRLGEEIRRDWKSPSSGVEILSKMREEEMMYDQEVADE